MAKAQKKKTINEPISISKIYETIKARDFLQELWWDLISDIKDKPTYKRMKEMVSSLINGTIRDFSTEPCSDAERLKRRTMLTEISIMTYTVDTVISEVLFRKLQNEFQHIVLNMIEELQAEHAVSRTLETGKSLENSQNIFTDTSKNEKEDRNKNSKVGPQGKTGSFSSQSSPEIPTIRARRGRPRKLNLGSINNPPDSISSTPKSRKRGLPALSPRKIISNTVAEKKSSTPSKSVSGSNAITTNNVCNIPTINGIKTEIDDIDHESDAESTVSDGNLSMTSVSSVHTSELSSFEDTISIDGDEESGQKKQIPLKVANDLYLQGTLSQIYEIGKRTEKQKKCLIPSVLPETKSPKHIASPTSSSLLRKVLPQRVRKPNSKYNSETIICEAYPTSSSFSPKVQTDSSLLVQTRQKRQKTSSIDDKSEKSTSSNSSPVRNSVSRNSPSAKVSPTVNHTSPTASSSKRYNASDLYKPRPSIGSSRGSSAITLFSTMNR